MSKPGDNVRKMADNRKNAAKQKFMQTGFLIITSLIIIFLPLLSPTIKVLICGASGICAFFCYLKGKQLLIRANQATKGADAETLVAEILQILEPRGWKIEHNILFEYGGDADFFLSSPQGNHFVIDVKSNSGRLFFNGDILKLRHGKNIYEFPQRKDILKAVKGQAVKLKKLKKVRFVQPILCFTAAKLEEIDQNQKIKGVYVVSSDYLVALLHKINSLYQ